MDDQTILYMAVTDVNQLIKQLPITSSVLQIVYNQLSQEQKRQQVNFYGLLYWYYCFTRLRDYYRQQVVYQNPDPEDYYQFSLLLRNQIPDSNWIRMQILSHPYNSSYAFTRLSSLFPALPPNPVGSEIPTVYASADQSCDIPTVQVTPPVVYPSPSPYVSCYPGAVTSAIPSVVPITAHPYSPYPSGVGQSSSPAVGGAVFSSQARVSFTAQSPGSFSAQSPAAFPTQSPASFTAPSPASFSTQSPATFPTLSSTPSSFTQSSIHGPHESHTSNGPSPATASLSPAKPITGSIVPVEVIKNQIRQKFNYDQIPDYDKLEFGITDTQNSQNASQLSTVC